MSMTTAGITAFEDRRAGVEPIADSLADSVARVMYDAWQGLPEDAQHAQLWAAVHEAVTSSDDVDAVNDPVAQLEEHAFIVGFETARRLMGGAK